VHLKVTGTFRSALRDLIAEGVVFSLERGFGHINSTLAIQKDFTKWGQYTVHPDRLARVYDSRPEANDLLLDEFLVAHAELAGPLDVPSSDLPPDGQSECPPERVPLKQSGQIEAGRVPLIGQSGGSIVGVETDDNSVFRRDLSGRKDIERQGKTEVVVSAREAAIRLTRVANKGLSEHASRPQLVPRILASQGRSLEAGEALLAEGVPIAFAEAHVYELARTHAADGEVRSLKYFMPAVLRLWEEEQARAAAAETTPPSITSGPAPTRGARSPPAARDRKAEAQRIVAEIRDLIAVSQAPAQAAVRFIPIARVESMGDRIARAYREVGGADRFLTVAGDKLSFLVRDFALALDSQAPASEAPSNTEQEKAS
jgi:hypothetical protein